MTDPSRTSTLVGSGLLGLVTILVCVALLVRIVKRAAGEGPASSRSLQQRLFFTIVGIVVGAWFLTYGVLALLLGV